MLELRYGLGGEHPRTLDEVGRTFNVTRERIRQIENQSLKKLQSLAEAQKLRESPSGQAAAIEGLWPGRKRGIEPGAQQFLSASSLPATAHRLLAHGQRGEETPCSCSSAVGA